MIVIYVSFKHYLDPGSGCTGLRIVSGGTYIKDFNDSSVYNMEVFVSYFIIYCLFPIV